MGKSTKTVTKAQYAGTTFFIGLDVHKKSWVVTIRHLGQHVWTFSMDPSPKKLLEKLRRDYPGGRYKSVYEAGFSGFWIHRALEKCGIENIVINPADVPTTHKERRRKSDKVDSRKLARELENGSLKAIYVPSRQDENIRSLYRIRKQTVEQQTAAKQRIKSYLMRQGIELVKHSELTHWSKNFLVYLRGIEFEDDLARTAFVEYLDELDSIRAQLLRVERLLRKLRDEHPPLRQRCALLQTVPGVGFVLSMALALALELIDMRRFRNLNHLASYVGLVPSITGSGDKQVDHGISTRRQRFLRYLLIEAAWVAIRRDGALRLKYDRWCQGMDQRQAIIRVAKSLLSRIRHVWVHEEPYVMGVAA